MKTGVYLLNLSGFQVWQKHMRLTGRAEERQLWSIGCIISLRMVADVRELIEQHHIGTGAQILQGGSPVLRADE